MHEATLAPLQARREGGGTAVLTEWGVDNEYGVLRDVLLGSPESHWMIAAL